MDIGIGICRLKGSLVDMPDAFLLILSPTRSDPPTTAVKSSDLIPVSGVISARK